MCNNNCENIGSYLPKGVRLTQARRFVLSLLADHAETIGMRAADVYAAAAKRNCPMALGTVYRILGELCRFGTVLRQLDGDATAYYRLRHLSAPYQVELLAADQVPYMLSSQPLFDALRREMQTLGVPLNADQIITIQIHS